MSATLGVNLRVTCHGSRGDRKYMEDFFVLNYEPSEEEHKMEYAFFGIFDGHGGEEAALFAKEHLMKFIVSDKRFWSEEDDDVLQSITNGFLQTHYAMWQDQVKWPKTSSGLPSTSGTTASIAFIRKGKIYIGHVGDSSIVLGYQKEGQSQWVGKALTKDHKPEDAYEVARIQSCGGKVVSKSGVPRVVWNRPRVGHKGPVRRSTPIDEIPFLAVARSLGDLWSYNPDKDEFVVSPYPDVHVFDIDIESHRCLIFGTDGLWNMLKPEDGVLIVQTAEQHNEENVYFSGQPSTAKNHMWVNPSKSLVDRALRRWATVGARADNTSAVTLMLDPPGAQRRSGERVDAPLANIESAASKTVHPSDGNPPVPKVGVGLSAPRVAIFTRPSSSEAVPTSVLPQPPTCAEPKSTEMIGKVESLSTTTVHQHQSESYGQLPVKQPQVSQQQSELCGGIESVKKPVMSNQSSAAKLPKGRCTPSEESVTLKVMARVNEHTGPKEITSKVKTPAIIVKALIPVLKTPAPLVKTATHLVMTATPLLKNPALQKDTGDSTADTKTENAFQTEEGGCCVGSSKAQEFQRLSEPSLQAAESSQRHSHKRLRGKTVNGAELSHLNNHNPLSLVRPSTSGGDAGIVRRRHSSVLDSRTGSVTAGFVSQSLGYSTPCGNAYQLGAKRRTRSEDKLQAVGRLDDDLKSSDEENKNVEWPVNWVNRLRPSDEGSEENNALSCSSRRKKKWIRCSGNAIGRVKQARPSVSIRSNSSFVNGCDIALSRDCNGEPNCSRVLRSDTLSGMPAHTLRSQNVEVKASRLSLHTPAKFTPKRSVQLKAALEMTSFSSGSSSLLPAGKLLLSSSGLAKRHRQSFCGRTRTVTTRSRVKRLSK